MKRWGIGRVAALALASASSLGAVEPIVGLPCEGCEAVFEGMPAEIGWETRLAPESEPGESLVIDGVVRDAGGAAVAGIVVYAYHTDAEGVYPEDPLPAGRAARRHGRLRGWAKSGDDGRFRFLTIRPASYPRSRIAQHVHMHVLEPGRCSYYIDDIKFADDPLLTDRERRSQRGRGGPGIVTPERDEQGTWQVGRDIVLGERIPGYEGCGD